MYVLALKKRKNQTQSLSQIYIRFTGFTLVENTFLKYKTNKVHIYYEKKKTNTHILRNELPALGIVLERFR